MAAATPGLESFQRRARSSVGQKAELLMRDMLFLFDIRIIARKGHHQRTAFTDIFTPAPGGLVSGQFFFKIVYDHSVSQGASEKGDFIHLGHFQQFQVTSPVWMASTRLALMRD